MKYLKHFNESVDYYNYVYDGTSDDGNSTYYRFNDGSNEFRLEIKKLDDTDVELFRTVYDAGEWSYKIVNTNIYRLLETIYQHILVDYLAENEWVETVVIHGLGKDKEKDEITQRTKVNIWYLSKYMIKGWYLDRYLNEVYLRKIV